MGDKGPLFKSFHGLVVLCFAALLGSTVPARAMPVKEVTVFKDGHVFVLHQGRMPTNAEGDVSLDRLPRPLIGTFWAYSADERAKLTSVTSVSETVSLRRTSLSVQSLLEANVGAKVRINEIGEKVYSATILSVPQRSVEELRRTSEAESEHMLPQRGEIVLLNTDEGVKAIPLSRIQDVTFLDSPTLEVTDWQVRPSMTYRLDWGGSPKGSSAEVGMTYVQRGIRWIPSYRVDLDGEGHAKIQLQATLVNELLDLNDVTAHLVVGVPTFAFQETIDPISLQQAAVRLSSQMRPDSRTAFSLSNAIMSQVAVPTPQSPLAATNVTLDLGPDIGGSSKNEDLYVFAVEHVSLKKGGRIVIPLAEYELRYRDLHVVDLPFAPPAELRRSFDSRQQQELATRLTGPKATHVVRLVNDAECPLTTAPALVLRGGRIIAQNMMTYTAIGAACDLELTTAVDVAVTQTDAESDRIPNALRIDGYDHARTNYTGRITIINRCSDTIELEIHRSILGRLDKADQDGLVQQLAGTDGTWLTQYGAPFWWDWYRWPYWWYRTNGYGRVTWTRKLESAETAEFTYEWHYFWRQ